MRRLPGVQLMPEKESAWWLNMVVRACWPIFLRDFLGRVVVPKLGPWFLNRFKPPMLVSARLTYLCASTTSVPHLSLCLNYLRASSPHLAQRRDRGLILEPLKTSSMQQAVIRAASCS